MSTAETCYRPSLWRAQRERGSGIDRLIGQKGPYADDYIVTRRVSDADFVEFAGGVEVIHRLKDVFYSSVLRDPVLRPLFGAGQPQHVEHLTAFTAESFGGPDVFTRELGFAHLIVVKSAWGAVRGLLPFRFPRPLAEPGVRLSPHRALHGGCRYAGASAQGDGM